MPPAGWRKRIRSGFCMCGFAGFVGAGDEAALQAMCVPLEHRGPDDSGSWHGGTAQSPVCLGFRRLAILDIEGGNQPMASGNGKLVVVFNGEIYNFRELRSELESLGHQFHSDHSDTEVLLYAYHQWGDEMVTHLSGMFSFVLYDGERQRLFCARDRFGKKPLFFARRRDGLIFASECSALLRHPDLDPAVDRQAVLKFFAYGFLPSPWTLYKGVSKLPPGHTLSYDLSTGRLQQKCYWRYRILPGEQPQGGPGEWAEELRHLLREAVGRRLESDVPLGIFLSGGLDSTCIAVLAAEHLDASKLETFSIGFREPSFDESSFARDAAARLGTRHNERILELGQATGLASDVLGRMDDPIADGSILPTYLLSQLAAEKVTVALSGDGADELFAGYDTFAALPWARLYQALTPGPCHGVMHALIDKLPVSAANMSLDFRLRRAMRGLGYPPSHWGPMWLGPSNFAELEALFGARLDAEEIYSEAIEAWNGSPELGLVDRSLEFYGRFYLSENILTKVDRASMFCSLEVRSPFLDNAVVDFAARLPSGVKFNRGRRKWLLKQAMAPLLPRQTLARKKKGFGIPLVDWLKRMPPPDAGLARALELDAGWLENCREAHFHDKADHRGTLWAWSCLSGSLNGANTFEGAMDKCQGRAGERIS
jgi:asparagine synthase (glutamine-hydrolysing)